MIIHVEIVEARMVSALRTRFRAECDQQIVHDSLHMRSGWTVCYQLSLDNWVVGFASTAVAGPWKDRPTIYEYYLLPEARLWSFKIFEDFLIFSQAKYFEVQSSQALLTSMLFRYAENIRSEAIVFYDHSSSQLAVPGAELESLTSAEDLAAAVKRRRGGGKWALKIDGVPVGTGGVLFHYNRPYADIHMEIEETHRHRGWGAFLVQELKQQCYRLGGVPCARCHPTNVASQRTLQKAGFVPYAHILDGDLSTSTIG